MMSATVKPLVHVSCYTRVARISLGYIPGIKYSESQV